MYQGTKGIVFVAIQLSLIAAYFLLTHSFSILVPEPIAKAAGIIAILGIVLTSIATIQLNTHLSPFPKPKANATLIQTGAYRFIRHPIYSGLFLFALGWAVHDGNAIRICISFALLSLFYLKAKFEEQLLEKAFGQYPTYKAKTGMLLPRFFKKKIGP